MTMYHPGYEVHWIQARHALDDDENWAPVRVTDARGDPIFVEATGVGESLVLWAKDARRIGASKRRQRGRETPPGFPGDAALCLRWSAPLACGDSRRGCRALVLVTN